MVASLHCLRTVASPSPRRRCKPAKLRRSGVPSVHPLTVAVGRDVRRERRERHVVANATDKNNSDAAFSKDDYVEAVIDRVTPRDQCGIVDFRLKDGKDSILPVYVGDFESSSLLNFITKKQSGRPMTYDLMRNAFRMLGFEVTQIHVTSLVGFTYHARIFFRSLRGGEELSVDARPSDAVNLAVRFNAPILVHRDIVSKMASSGAGAHSGRGADVSQLCQEEISLHDDPTVVLKLQMQVAIAQEKYATAAKLRDEIEELLATDRVLSLFVAIESALKDKRYEDALQIRDELKRLRETKGSSEKQESH